MPRTEPHGRPILSRRRAVMAGGMAAAAALGSAELTSAEESTPVAGTPAASGQRGELRPLLSNNPMWDEFGNRALLLALDRGADFGEVLTVIATVGDGGVDEWFAAWMATADRVAGYGDESAAAGHRVSAREAYFRASTYCRSAYFPLYGKPVDPRLVAAFDKEVDYFLRGAALADHVIEPVEIPYEQMTIPGYFITANGSASPRPTIIYTNGYDSTIQEMYFANAIASLRRGYSVLLFDGPGQGRNLIKDGIPMRPDWESVVSPVMDYALTRPEVDPTRVALSGWSLGGFLAPRAAAFDDRFAALIADPGQWDERDAILAVLPLTEVQKAAFPDIDPALLEPMEDYLKSDQAPAMLRWSIIKRGFWVNGVSNLYDFAVAFAKFEISPYAKNITCPTFISQAMDDSIAAGAPRLFENISSTEKVLVQFTAAEGADMHVEAMARTLFDQRMFDWLDGILQPAM